MNSFKDVVNHLETSHKGKYFDRVGKENVFILKYFAKQGLENGIVWIPIKLTSSCGATFFTIGKVVKDSLCLGVVFMGSSDEAKNYSITIQGSLLKGIDNWSGVVPSVVKFMYSEKATKIWPIFHVLFDIT